MNCEYVREYYNVPACIGRIVIVDGKPGIISEDRGHHIGVNFDEDKPGVVLPAHPTWKVEYKDMGKIRKITPSQKRYQDYLKVADFYDSFYDYLKDMAWKSHCERYSY